MHEQERKIERILKEFYLLIQVHLSKDVCFWSNDNLKPAFLVFLMQKTIESI